jgi:hypothetical protein
MKVLTQRTPVHRRPGQDGTAMVLVLLVVAVLSLLGIAGTRSAQTELQMARGHRSGKQALSVAEAGILHAYALIKASPPASYDGELSNGGTGGLLTNVGELKTLSGVSYRFRSLGGGAADGYYVQALDNYDETTGANDPATDRDRTIRLVSHGRVGGAERVVEALVKGASLFPVGVWGKKSVTLSGGGGTDSFDSTAGDYSAQTPGQDGTVRSNGDISVSGSNTVVNGDAIASGTTSVSTNGVVTGTQTSGAPPLSFPSVPVCGPPYSSGAGISGSNYTYDPSTGALGVMSWANITLAGGTYCFSSLNLSAHAVLTVTSPVTIYLTAPSDLSGGTIVNTTHLASDLKIFSSLVSNPKDKKTVLALSGGQETYMAVYAPDAWITFSGNTSFYGAVIGSIVDDSGGTPIHYDTALQTVPGFGVSLSKWHEVRN